MVSGYIHQNTIEPHYNELYCNEFKQNKAALQLLECFRSFGYLQYPDFVTATFRLAHSHHNPNVL